MRILSEIFKENNKQVRCRRKDLRNRQKYLRLQFNSVTKLNWLEATSGSFTKLNLALNYELNSGPAKTNPAVSGRGGIQTRKYPQPSAQPTRPRSTRGLSPGFPYFLGQLLSLLI